MYSIRFKLVASAYLGVAAFLAIFMGLNAAGMVHVWKDDHTIVTEGNSIAFPASSPWHHKIAFNDTQG